MTKSPMHPAKTAQVSAQSDQSLCTQLVAKDCSSFMGIVKNLSRLDEYPGLSKSSMEEKVLNG